MNSANQLSHESVGVMHVLIPFTVSNQHLNHFLSIHNQQRQASECHGASRVEFINFNPATQLCGLPEIN